MLTVDTLIQIVVVGICTGFGSALGNYLAQRSFIKHIDKITKNSKK